MDHEFTPGETAHTCFAINDAEGTMTSFNVYGAPGDRFLGKGYDAEGMTYDLPAPGDEKWKKWRKKGYEFVENADLLGGVVTLELAKVAKPEPAAK